LAYGHFRRGQQSKYLWNRALDWNLRSYAKQAAPDTDIVILDIDERPWRLSPLSMVATSGHALHFPSLSRCSKKTGSYYFSILFVDPFREHSDDDFYFMTSFDKQTIPVSPL